MLQPRPGPPRRTAVKYAIVALCDASRAELLAWLLAGPAGDGRYAPLGRAPATWLDLVKAAIALLDVDAQRWVKRWAARWVDERGRLAIPAAGASTFSYPADIVFDARERSRKA